MHLRELVLILSVSALALGPAPLEEEAPARGIRYPGASYLFELDQLTVVYPAGPGEHVEKNRASAELRAGLLEEVHGVRVRVISDEQIAPGELTGNLLVLGWNNRVLGNDNAVRPFARTDRGLDFLGVQESDPAVDLLFYAASPFDPEGMLAFWSRIDPERDRFQALPRVGSDWAMIRDFNVVRQGMFRPGLQWPPKRDPASEHEEGTLLAEIRRGWAQQKTDHYRIRYDPAELDAAEIRAIASARERAWAGAATALDASPETVIDLYVYVDSEQKEQFTGVPDPAHSVPSKGELHMVLPYARSASPHEEIHLLARDALGPCYLTTIYEGLALSEDRVLEGLDIAVQTAMMIQAGAFPSLDDLLDETAARTLPDRVRYPASGMLMQWVRETADGESLDDVYGLTRGSVENLAAAVGIEAAALEPAFREWLDGQVAAHDDDLRFVEYESLARDRHMAGDYEGLVEVMRKMHELRPDDPQTLFNLASAQMRTGDYADAETALHRLLDLQLGPGQSRFVIFTHYQLGRLYDVQGRRDDALVEYRLVLELPDQNDAHRLAREAIETPITKAHLE